MWTMDADRDRWDGRWSGAHADAGNVSALAPDVITAHSALETLLPTDGPALDLACGVGAQSLWLAECGLQVTALDVSPVAIGIAAAAAATQGLDVDARVWDTDAGLPVDLTGLAMIVCQRYRAPHLFTEFVDRLRPGGALVLTVLSAVGCAGEPGPFHVPAGELTTAFRAAHTAGIIDILVNDEANGQASVVIRRLES